VTEKWREQGRGLVCALGRMAVSMVMLALVLAAGGCGNDAGGGATATVTPTGRPSPTPTATPTPTPTPTPTLKPALWVENALGNSVVEFKGDTITNAGVSVPTPAVTNTSPAFSDPAGVTFDGSKNQWVTNCTGSSSNHGSITEFKMATLGQLPSSGSPPPDVAISDDGSGNLVNCPWTMTFNSGNLWAANSNEFTAPPGFVTEYQPSQLGSSGHPTPHITLTDPSEFTSPTGVLFDSSGNLFVTDFGPGQFAKAGSGKIWVFNAAKVGALTPGTNNKKSDVQLFDPTTAQPVNGALDSSGNLWVVDCAANEIYMFSKSVLTSGASTANAIFQSTSITTPNGTEKTIDCPGGIAFDKQGNLWYTNFFSAVSPVSGAVAEFTKSQLSATGTSTPTPNIFLDGNTGASNFNGPIGLTFGPAT
jgi:hypothetical protein